MIVHVYIVISQYKGHRGTVCKQLNLLILWLLHYYVQNYYSILYSRIVWYNTTKWLWNFTSGNSLTVISFPLFDFMKDFTSPWCMYDITINGTGSVGVMLTPIRLNTFGWSNFLAILHSLMKSSAVDDEKSTNKSD